MWSIAGFFFVATGIYIFFHFLELPDFDYMGDFGVGFWVGVLGLGLTSVYGAFQAIYLQMKYRKQGGELPEDILTANIDDGDPETGFYSPWSWWPILTAAALAVLVIGLATGFWLAFYSIPLIAVTLVGVSLEYNRGVHRH